MHRQPQFVLASASPRRVELLKGLGLVFTTAPQAIDESRHAAEGIEHFVMRLAREKALPAAVHQALPVLGADTIVIIDGEVLGKPLSSTDGISMLERLSGRQHQVMTAVTVVQGARVEALLSVSDVSFREVTAAEARAYWQTGEPADKAGGYAIQGIGAIFVNHLQGSYSGVMGLPVFETAQLLQRFGVHCLE